MAGSATPTIVVSSTFIRTPAQTTASATQREQFLILIDVPPGELGVSGGREGPDLQGDVHHGPFLWHRHVTDSAGIGNNGHSEPSFFRGISGGREYHQSWRSLACPGRCRCCRLEMTNVIAGCWCTPRSSPAACGDTTAPAGVLTASL